jgi:hypothetical protein
VGAGSFFRRDSFSVRRRTKITVAESVAINKLLLLGEEGRNLKLSHRWNRRPRFPASSLDSESAAKSAVPQRPVEPVTDITLVWDGSARTWEAGEPDVNGKPSKSC